MSIDEEKSVYDMMYGNKKTQGNGIPGFQNIPPISSIPDMYGKGSWMDKVFGNSNGNTVGGYDQNKKGSGLGGFGTASQWNTGLGVVNALGGLYGLSLQKDSLGETRKHNRFNSNIALANLDMGYNTYDANLLEAQGKASAIGDWVASQGQDASKYTDLKGLGLANRANISYG